MRSSLTLLLFLLITCAAAANNRCNGFHNDMPASGLHIVQEDHETNVPETAQHLRGTHVQTTKVNSKTGATRHLVNNNRKHRNDISGSNRKYKIKEDRILNNVERNQIEHLNLSEKRSKYFFPTSRLIDNMPPEASSTDQQPANKMVEIIDQPQTENLNDQKETKSHEEAYQKTIKQVDGKANDLLFKSNATSIKYYRKTRKRKAWQPSQIATNFQSKIVDSDLKIPIKEKGSCDYCLHNGLCVLLNEDPVKFKCHCLYGFKGKTCEMRSITNKACFPNTCLNGGTCIERRSSTEKYHCICATGYHGQQCSEKDVMNWETWLD